MATAVEVKETTFKTTIKGSGKQKENLLLQKRKNGNNM